MLVTNQSLTKIEKSVPIQMDSLLFQQLSPFPQLALLPRPKLKVNHNLLETISAAK